MSPAPTNPLEQVSKVLQPNAAVSTTEKVAVLQAFSATLTGTWMPSIRSFTDKDADNNSNRTPQL